MNSVQKPLPFWANAMALAPAAKIFWSLPRPLASKPMRSDPKVMGSGLEAMAFWLKAVPFEAIAMAFWPKALGRVAKANRNWTGLMAFGSKAIGFWAKGMTTGLEAMGLATKGMHSGSKPIISIIKGSGKRRLSAAANSPVLHAPISAYRER